MLITCSECDKKVKVSDASAGKNIRCPECGNSIAVPGKASGIKDNDRPRANRPATPATKSRQAVDDANDDAGDEPKEKSNLGLIVGLVIGGVLLLLLVLGGVGAWYVFNRDQAPDAGDAGQLVKERRAGSSRQGKSRSPWREPGASSAHFTDKIRMSVDFYGCQSEAQ